MRPTDEQLNMAVCEVLGEIDRKHDFDTFSNMCTCFTCGEQALNTRPGEPCIPPYCSDDSPRRLLWPLIDLWEARKGRYDPALMYPKCTAREVVELLLKALGAWRKEWDSE